MMPMFDVHAFILVGGESRRMGEDKARLAIGAQTSVELIASALQSVTKQITTVGWPKQKCAALANIPDLRPGWGPLAGIETALRHASSEYVLIVACDFPFVKASLFERLLELADQFDAIVPLQNDDRLQPLCAIYRVATCMEAVDAAIAANEHSPRALLERVSVRYVPFSVISDLDGSNRFFFNMNTRVNYQEARRMFEGDDHRS